MSKDELIQLIKENKLMKFYKSKEWKALQANPASEE